jgi:hypothetical protein
MLINRLVVPHHSRRFHIVPTFSGEEGGKEVGQKESSYVKVFELHLQDYKATETRLSPDTIAEPFWRRAQMVLCLDWILSHTTGTHRERTKDFVVLRNSDMNSVEPLFVHALSRCKLWT